MARLIPIQCPQCGSGLKVQATDEIIHCQYCQTSCFIRRPGMTMPPVVPPGMRSPTLYVDLPKRSSGVGVVLGCAGTMAGLTAAGGFMIDACITRQAKKMKSLVDERRQDAGVARDPKATAASTPKLVDAAEVIETAIAEARKNYPDARFVNAHFSGVRSGMVDVNADNVAHVIFEYRRVDSSKPAGTDVEEGSFHITVDEGRYAVWAHHLGHGPSSMFGKGLAATVTPKCRAAAAWKTAVDSGVPANAIAKLHFDRNDPFRGDPNRVEWSFSVEGHDEYRREIDATTCALRRAWNASGSRVTATPGAPRR